VHPHSCDTNVSLCCYSYSCAPGDWRRGNGDGPAHDQGMLKTHATYLESCFDFSHFSVV